MNAAAFAKKSWPLLMLAMTACCTSCKTPTPTTSETQKLYGLPRSMAVLKGTEIQTTAGIVVVPEDTVLWSHGAFTEQVERALRITSGDK